MKALLLVIGSMGLAAGFGFSEPMPASSRPVTTDDVQVLSEQTPTQDGSQGYGRNGRGGGRGGRYIRG